MKLCVQVEVKAVFYHKMTCEPLIVNRVIKKEYDDSSEEFLDVVIEYQNKLEMERGKTVEEKDRFDEKMLRMMADDMKENTKAIIERIEGVIKTCFTNGVAGYIELGGYVLNPNDFCAVKIDSISCDINKRR